MSRIGGAVLAVAIAVAAASCGTDSDSSDSSSGGAVTTLAATDAGGGSTFEPGAGGEAVPTERQIVTTADVALQTDDVAGGVSRAMDLVTANGGYLADQQVGLGDPASATVTVKVPPERLGTVLDGLRDVGKIGSLSQRAEDVTSQAVDLDARIATARTSVERLRTFLGEATSVTDVAALEAELTTRETELERLVAAQRSLAGQVAMATLTMRFSEPEPDAVADIPGVGTALRAGLDAFLAAGQVALVALAWSLPFLALAAAVVAVLLLWRSHRRRHRPAQALPPPRPSARLG